MRKSHNSISLSRISLMFAALLIGGAAATITIRTAGEKALAEEIIAFRAAVTKGQLSFVIGPGSAGEGEPPLLAVHLGNHSPLFRVDCRRENGALMPVPAVRQNGAKWHYMTAAHPLRSHASRAAELVDCRTLAERHVTS